MHDFVNVMIVTPWPTAKEREQTFSQMRVWGLRYAGVECLCNMDMVVFYECRYNLVKLCDSAYCTTKLSAGVLYVLL